MQYTRLSIAAILGSMSLALAEPIATARPLGTAIGGALDSTHAYKAPSATAAAAVPALVTTGPLTISVHNSESVPISVTYGSNSGAPAPLSSPTPGPLAPGADLEFVAPEGWAGRIVVGLNFDAAGSKIEGSFINNSPNIDVSYVDGFSLPVVCSCDGRGVVSGCNTPLFTYNECPNQGAGPICYNPEQGVPNGPPSAFFAPCEHCAYTYPKDDAADTGCAAHTIHCCVGSLCPPHPNQPSP